MTASQPVERQIEVAIYAARTSDKAAAEQYAIPRRTVTNIRNRWQDTPEFRIARAKLASRLADQYADLEQLAIDRAANALRDPKTPARDLASIGKWVSEQRALTTGDVTSRTEATRTDVTTLFSDEEQDKVGAFIRTIAAATDEELREWAANGGLAQLRATGDEAWKPLEAGDG